MKNITTEGKKTPLIPAQKKHKASWMTPSYISADSVYSVHISASNPGIGIKTETFLAAQQPPFDELQEHASANSNSIANALGKVIRAKYIYQCLATWAAQDCSADEDALDECETSIYMPLAKL